MRGRAATAPRIRLARRPLRADHARGNPARSREGATTSPPIPSSAPSPAPARAAASAPSPSRGNGPINSARCSHHRQLHQHPRRPRLPRPHPQDRERKPIRVFLQDGSGDLDNRFGNWPLANQQMAAALRYMKYNVKFEFARRLQPQLAARRQHLSRSPALALAQITRPALEAVRRLGRRRMCRGGSVPRRVAGRAAWRWIAAFAAGGTFLAKLGTEPPLHRRRGYHCF